MSEDIFNWVEITILKHNPDNREVLVLVVGSISAPGKRYTTCVKQDLKPAGGTCLQIGSALGPKSALRQV